MANDLTGDYDVAVQLSLDAVNRVTAALHSVKRFPHSLSMAIDDRPNRTLPTVVAGVVDLNGSAVVNPKVIENGVLASVASGWGVLTQDVVDNLDPVVNPLGGLVNPGPEPVETEYSYVYGVAQAQLGAPSMKLPKGHSDQAEIHTPAMIRYFANTSDPKTDSLSPFLKGEIVTTFAVKSVTSKAGANIVVDLAGPSGNVHFDSARSEVALDAADKKAIDLALSKVLKHGFEPSSTPRPDNVLAMDFRGYPSESAIGMLMNVTTHNDPSPDSVRNVFLHSDDQFALALNGDGFTDQFSSAVNSAIDPMRVENIDATVTINYWIGSYTFHIYTRITVGTATVQLTNTP
ncbi:MAG TPA: hypothetical protein VEU11_15900, partial [Terriglobales bacterium]|nr:hypothetical protein [Terriglobales bacterium]